MRLHKANFAGLTSPGQQSEMKAILAGSWPPLKPLPVFKYETAEYRATIDFDKKRGEWACRKTSLPSNEVQELRGGLREITLALPHGEAETFVEAAESQEPELERETNRRLQAIREWREKYENGARFFELRDFLSERRRAELDDSLRLSLTARQLQFNPKNAANVFDDLSVAGGRFAALIDLAKRIKENQGIDPQAQGEESGPDAEPALDHAQQSEGIGALEIVHVQNDQKDASTGEEPVPIAEAAEPRADADEFPALAIKDIFPEQGHAPLAERMVHAPTQLETETTEVVDADSPCDVDEFPSITIKDVSREQERAPLVERMGHTPTQPLEAETAEVVDADSPSEADEFPAVTIKNVSEEPERTPLAEWLGHRVSHEYETEASEILDDGSASLVEPPHEEEPRSPVMRGIGAQARATRSFFNRIEDAARAKDAKELFSENRIEDSYSRFPALRISAFQVNVFAILFLFAVTSFTVGLTVGRGPLGKRLREPPKLFLAADSKPPALPDADSPVLTDQGDESTPQTPTPPVASSHDSADAHGPGEATPSEEKSKTGTRTATVSGLENAGDRDSAQVVPTDADSSPRIEPRPPAKPVPGSEPNGAIGPIVRNVWPPARSKLVRPHKVVRSIHNAPRSRAPYRLTSPFAEPPHLPRASAILVTVPGGGSQPFKVSFPEKTIAATSSLAMTSQLSVFVSGAPGPALAYRSARLEAGDLVSFGWPRYRRPADGYGFAETIRVRATIGQLGQVQEVKFLSGSTALLPATTEAIRQWRYAPTLLDKRPVQAQQDITIEFRPLQYSSQLRTQHLPHN
ncbi:MAG TPA: energy transducer TonB [Candidatus Acidoferrum sp.]|nr:energy transducer TonB [Candidatus Acidoferrum sp.]